MLAVDIILHDSGMVLASTCAIQNHDYLMQLSKSFGQHLFFKEQTKRSFQEQEKSVQLKHTFAIQLRAMADSRDNDRSRSRSPPRKPKSSSSGFRWKDKSKDTSTTGSGSSSRDYNRGYRDRSPRRDNRSPRRDSNRDSRDHGRDSRDYGRNSRGGDGDRYRPRDRSPRRDRDRARSPRSEKKREDRHKDRKDKDKSAATGDKPPSRPAAATAPRMTEPMIIVNVNDRLGTKASIPCLASDPVSELPPLPHKPPSLIHMHQKHVPQCRGEKEEEEADRICNQTEAFKAMVAARIGRQPHEIMLKRQGERPFKDQLTLEDYGVSNGVQLDLELDTGD